MKAVRKWILLLATIFFSGLAGAHSEPVQVVAMLEHGSGGLEIKVNLVGEVSTLPIRGAVLEARLTKADPGILAWMQNGAFARTGKASLPAEVVAKTALQEGKAGEYTGRLEVPGPGAYVFVLVDTTFRAEATMTGWRLDLPLPPTPTIFTGLMPKTTTPSRYLTYALIGLAVPALIGVVFALLARSDQRL